MSFECIVLFLIILGIIGGFGCWKLIKHFNYELNFNESLLFFISILLSTILCLVDFSLLQIDINFGIIIGIIIYFLILLILYYIIRSIKLKKYIPLKSIIGYILISVVNIIILFNVFKLSNIDGFAALFLFIIYLIIYSIYIILLLLINTIIFIIKLIKRNNIIYKNQNYKISKYSLINIVLIILLIGLIFAINYYNKQNYNKIINKQKEIVIKYLKTEYSDYSFEIINSYETKVDCGFMMCTTPAFRNEIKEVDLNKTFTIDVKKDDLTIYKDEFKEIIFNNELNKNSVIQKLE